MKQIYLYNQEEIEKEEKLFSLVDYDEAYFDYLFNLHKDNFKGYFEAHYGKWNDNRQGRSFAKQLSSGNYKMIVHNSEVVGLINLQDPQEKQGPPRHPYDGLGRTPAVLRYLCIDEKVRGKGIGTAIIRKIIQKICSFDKLTLKVYTDNPMAQKLYSRFGFLIDPEQSDDDYLTMIRPYFFDRNIRFRRWKDRKYREEHGISLPE